MAIIFSTASNSTVAGTAAADLVLVLASHDTVFGYGGDDLVVAIGQDNVLYGDSLVTGGPGSGTGSDTVLGGFGNDTIWGGAGADVMAGGAGADAFSFGWVPQAKLPTLDTTDFRGHNDLILDFSQGQGDRVDLTGYLATGEAGVFLGTDAFTDADVLQVRYDIVAGQTLVQVKVPLPTAPPSGAVTGEILLAGAHALTAADFILAT